MRTKHLRRFVALGLVSVIAIVVSARTEMSQTTGSTNSGWWNRRLPLAQPVKPAPRLYRQPYVVTGVSAEEVARTYLERNWEWLTGADSTDRGHANSYVHTKTSESYGMDKTVAQAVGFRQLFDEVPVYRGEFCIVIPGNPANPYPEFGGSVFAIKDLDVSSPMSREDAIKALKAAIAPDSLYSTELVDTIIYDPRNMPPARELMRKMSAYLIVYPSDPPVLAYSIGAQVWALNGMIVPYSFLVDAKSGELLQGISTRTDWDPSTGFGPDRIVPPPAR